MNKGRWFRLIAPAAGEHLKRLMIGFYGLMFGSAFTGWLARRLLPAEPAGEISRGFRAAFGPMVNFAFWIAAGWQHRWPVFVAANFVLIVGFGLLAAVWQPGAWAGLGILAFNLAITCLLCAYVGLFFAFLPTLLPEIFAALLGISAGLNLNDRRAAGIRPWLVPEDVWILVTIVLCLLPAGYYEALFIARIT